MTIADRIRCGCSPAPRRKLLAQILIMLFSECQRTDALTLHQGRVPGRGLRGADRDRTGDLLVANQTLSQLSYSPQRKDPTTVLAEVTSRANKKAR